MKRGTLFPGGTDVHIQQHIHQKDLNLCSNWSSNLSLVSMSLSNLFLIKFSKFLVLYFGCGCYFWFYNTYEFTLSFLWIKNMSAKTTKYIRKCWERSVKSLNPVRVIKNSSFGQHFLYTDVYMVQNFLKFLWWRFLVPRSKLLLVGSAAFLQDMRYFKFVNVSIL